MDESLLLAEIDRLRKTLDQIKVRSYELGQKELHDMAWEALTEDARKDLWEEER